MSPNGSKEPLKTARWKGANSWMSCWRAPTRPHPQALPDSPTHCSKQLACLPDIRLHCTTTPSSEVRCRSRGNPTAECDSQEGATKKNGQSVL